MIICKCGLPPVDPNMLGGATVICISDPDSKTLRNLRGFPCETNSLFFAENNWKRSRMINWDNSSENSYNARH